MHLRMIDRGGREKIIVMEMVHVRRRGRSGGQIGAVETVHVRRMKREGEEVKYVRW